ncbi:hypothetical protein PF003_g8380 [Phytophthora fragariae]|nr:hypothetical protein PF003_g8380 [Phytophthora fragariae]
MSENVFRRRKEACPEVEFVELETPIRCITVGGDVDVHRAANLHITLRTAVGPVSIATPVQCLIVPGKLEEFLLGKDILASLGIDVDRDLELLVSGDQLDEPGGFDEPEVNSAPGLSKELERLVHEMVGRAGAKGFLNEYLDELL